MNLITICIFTLLFIMLLYVSAILFNHYFFKKSMSEAKHTVDDFLDKIIDALRGSNSNTLRYDILIGSNGVSVRDEIVNHYFEKLYDIFNDWYFNVAYFPTSNVVCYEFRVYNCKLENFDKKRILARVKQIAEKALVMHFHDRGIYTIPVDNFIAVTLYSDVLKVFIACNDAGFSEIEAIRQQPK